MADGTVVAALIVAAVGIAVGPIIARLTYSWARKSDDGSQLVIWLASRFIG